MPDGRDADPVLVVPMRPYGPRVRDPDEGLDDAERRRRRWLLAILVGVHLLLLLGLRAAMDPNLSPFGIPQRERVLEVRFVPPDVVEEPVVPDPALEVPEAQVLLPTMPAPATTPRPTVAPQPTTVPRAAPVVDTPEPRALQSDGLSARWVPAPETPPPRLQLFNPDGSMDLSQEVIDASQPRSATPDFHAPARGAAPWADKRSTVPYEPTALDGAWKPDGENVLDEVVRRATVTKSFRTPWGTTVKCGVVLIMGGCAWGQAPTPLRNAPPAPGMSNPVPPPDPPDGG